MVRNSGWSVMKKTMQRRKSPPKKLVYDNGEENRVVGEKERLEMALA